MARRPNVCTYEETIEEGSDAIDFSCDPAFNDNLILAEGDSWFTIGGHTLQNPWFSNTLFSLRFQKDTLVLNLAQPGDTIKHISAMPKDHSFKFAIEQHDSHPWGVILLSAGGNDLIDKAHTLIMDKLERGNKPMNKPEDYCKASEVDHFLHNIGHHFKRLANMRGNHKIPILVHTYDYPTARNSPARFLGLKLGPWLYKAFTEAQVPKKDWRGISDYLFNKLADKILTLPAQIPDFHVVDTRKTLVRAKANTVGNSGDWLNEIHPNKNGYKKIARKIEIKLKEVCGI